MLRALVSATSILAVAVVMDISATTPTLAQMDTRPPASCAGDRTMGEAGTQFTNHCSYPVYWMVTCQMEDMHCAVHYRVDIAPGESQRKNIPSHGFNVSAVLRPRD